MGAWSDYPDGNDHNVDVLACFINQYFGWQENKSEEYLEYDEENNDPGLQIRMGLRTGGSPVFTADDLSSENQDAVLELLKSYHTNHESETIIGLSISWARLLANEPFGIFDGKELPKSNLLSSQINDYVLNTLQPEQGEVREFFGGENNEDPDYDPENDSNKSDDDDNDSLSDEEDTNETK